MPLDFELSEEQKLLQVSAREFALKEFTKEKAVEYEQKGEFPWDLYRKCAQQGYVGMTWPEEYGGQGLSFVDSMIVAYELVKVEPVIASAIMAGTFGSDIIASFGTHEQKAKWLPRLAKGEITSAGCFTEPAGGSDIARVLDTKAVKQGEYWIINGTKTFITNATTATIFVTLVQTNMAAQPPYRGQTEFIIERGPGVDTTPLTGKLGWHVSPTGEVSFSDVRVTDNEIVGGPVNLNRGFYLGLMFLDATRLAVAIQAIATAEAALERAITYSKEREAFGRKIAAFQGLTFRMVEMATKVEAAKALCFKGAWLTEKARKEPALMEESVKIASMCKWYCGRLAVEACDLAVDVLGGLGYFSEEDTSRWYKFAKMLELVEGTKEIQKNAITRIMFGREIAKYF
ncbi:MAG: acyl-CoA dehydrogenase family protein [Candidatus Bathyarchaeota archaeon]